MPRGRPRTNMSPMRQLNWWTTQALAERLDAACAEDGVQRKVILDRLVTDHLNRRQRKIEKKQRGGT